jgi:hypothetical protein
VFVCLSTPQTGAELTLWVLSTRAFTSTVALRSRHGGDSNGISNGKGQKAIFKWFPTPFAICILSFAI